MHFFSHLVKILYKVRLFSKSLQKLFTTGVPKGVMVTHRMVLSCIAALDTVLGVCSFFLSLLLFFIQIQLKKPIWKIYNVLVIVLKYII